MLKGLAFLLKRCVQYQKKETIFCFTFAFLYMGIAKKAGRQALQPPSGEYLSNPLWGEEVKTTLIGARKQPRPFLWPQQVFAEWAY